MDGYFKEEGRKKEKKKKKECLNLKTYEASKSYFFRMISRMAHRVNCSVKKRWWISCLWWVNGFVVGMVLVLVLVVCVDDDNDDDDDK